MAAVKHRWNLHGQTLTHVCWVCAVIIGAVHAWAERHAMGSDGISYLDVADAYMNADWNAAINGYWGPLYSWFLGSAMYLLRPSPYWEFPVVHLVNFVIYLLGLTSFAFFLSEFIRYHHRVADGLRGFVFLPSWACVILGYSLFVWSSMAFTNPSLVSPDACLAALVFLASALLVRSKRKGEAAHIGLFACLGVVLGLGYLTKAAMLPLALVFMMSSVLPIGNLKRDLLRGSALAIAFVLVAAPFVIALSASKGRLTFGDTAKLSYAWFVSGVKYRHWQGARPEDGIPKNMTRTIFQEPTVYEFARPIKTTYAPWGDPSHWYEGLEIRFSFEKQMTRLRSALAEYSEALSGQEFVLTMLLAGSATLHWMGFQSRKQLNQVAGIHWHLIAPGLAAVAMYSLVHIESRFLAPFIVLFWLGIWSRVILPESLQSTKLLTCISMIMVLALGMKVAVLTVRPAYVTARELVKSDYDSRAEMWHVADGLHRMGILPGDKVAIIGWGSDESYWARLARVNIAAEISISHGWGFSEGDKFWSANETVKSEVYRSIAQAGIKAVVASVPNSVSSDGWQKIGTTGYSAYILDRIGLPN